MSDFDVFLEAGGEPALCSLLAVSSEGVARTQVAIPLADPEFQALKVRVCGKEKSLSLREDFGNQLYKAVFQGDVLAAWAKAEASPDGVRLRLVIDAPEVSTLPWELLHDGANFLATNAALALSRYIPVPEPRIGPVVSKLKVLLVSASPASLPPIPSQELEALEEDVGKVADVTSIRKCTIQALADAIASNEFHVVHYLGHGAKGNLLLEGRDGVDPLSDQAFGQMLLGRPATRLVVLNACSSAQSDGGVFAGVAPALIRTRVPAVVAMQYEFVQLSTAQIFNRRFYAELAKGTPVDLAVNRARNEISSTKDLLQQRDWSTPILYLGTRNGRLITFQSEEVAGVERAFRSVQNAVVKDADASDAWRELVGTFENLRQSYLTLGTLIELRNLVDEVGEELEPIVQTAEIGIAGAEFHEIKKDWDRLSSGPLPRLRAVKDKLPQGDLRIGLEKVLGCADAVSDSIRRMALQELEQSIQKLREALTTQDSALGLRVTDAIAGLIAVSDRTLGRMAGDD